MIEETVKDALSHVRPIWDESRTESAILGLKRKRRRRAIARIATASIAILFLAVSVSVILQKKPTGPIEPSSRVAVAQKSKPSSTGTFFLPDGSFGQPVDALSRLVVEEVSDDFVSLVVEAGKFDFEVAYQPQRSFEVRAGEVTTTVLGTAFSVGLEGKKTRVAVVRGEVHVSWPGNVVELREGMSGTFPQDAAPPILDDASGSAIEETKPDNRRSRPDWRRHTRAGEFGQAAAIIEKVGVVKDTVEDLLLAADAMRLSGKPAKALPYLEQVAAHHRKDPRVPLAEFTRGRVLLVQLGRPRAAAEAFARARQLAPKGSLAQDALAREVESWHRAQEPDHARKLALKYLDKYPNGRRVRAVRQFGGL